MIVLAGDQHVVVLDHYRINEFDVPGAAIFDLGPDRSVKKVWFQPEDPDQFQRMVLSALPDDRIGHLTKAEKAANKHERSRALRQIRNAQRQARSDRRRIPFRLGAAESLGGVLGSWTFLMIMVGVILAYVFLQHYLGRSFHYVPSPPERPGFVSRSNAFDPYPFLALNFGLTVLAALQGALLLVANKRRESDVQRLLRGGEQHIRDIERTENTIEQLVRRVHDSAKVELQRDIQQSITGVQRSIDDLRRGTGTALGK